MIRLFLIVCSIKRVLLAISLLLCRGLSDRAVGVFLIVSCLLVPIPDIL